MSKKFLRSNMRKKMALFVVMAMLFSMLPMEAILVQAAEGEGNSEVAVASGSAVEVEEEKIVMELDDDNKDEQGILYTLDSGTMTATVGRTYETSSHTKNSSMYGGKNSGHVIIPEYVRYNDNEYEVTTIGAHAFHGNEWIRTVSISDTVTEIDWASFVGAFSGCPNLYSVHIGARLSEFGSVTFSETPCLRNITVSDGNPYFTIQNEILYSADKTSAYKCFAKDGTQKIYVAEETTEIEENAFQNIDAEAVYLPENLKKIQPYAFQYSTLEYINLENVTYIGEYAFTGCRNLKFLNLGSITSSARAFRDCYGAEVVYFKNKATDDMTNAYNLEWIIYEKYYPYSTSYGNASKVKHVIFADTATQINFSCFTSMSKLEKLYIPESVTTIAGTPSTNNKSNLTIYATSGSAAHIYAQEQGLNYIDMSTHLHSQEEIIVYEDEYVKATGLYCEGCNTLKNFAVEIQEEGKYVAPEDEKTEVTVDVLDEDNRDSYGIQYTLNENTKTASVKSNCGYNGANDGVVVLPDYVKKGDTVYMVTAIAINAFSDTNELRSLSISDTITTVQFPIVNAQTIEEIHLGANVSTWGVYNYENLKKLTVSSQNTTYYARDNVLYDYNMTKVIYYPSGKEGQVFEIPKKVSYIGEYAFRNTQLKQVVMNGITTISNYAFYASAMEGVDLTSVTNIQAQAFQGCNNLQYAIIPNTITVRAAFNNCENLSCVIMKNGSSLSAYDASTDLSTTSGSFENCSNLTCVVLPDDLTEIPANCFKNCTSLKKVYVPETVETISEYAFAGCSKDLTVYSSSVDVLRFAKNHFSYVQIKEHEHNFEEITLFENDTTTIIGEWCSECEYITNCQTVSGVVIIPTASPTVTPTASPTVTPTVTPTASPTVTPIISPTVNPTATPTINPTANSGVSTKVPETTVLPKTQLPAVTNFKVKTRDNKYITLSWRAVTGANGYEIYRSRSKNKNFKLLKKVDVSAGKYVDKKVKVNKKYYYQIRAIGGKWSIVRGKSVNGMTAPKVKITKGKTGSIRYLTIHLKKYKGKYVQIYMKKKGKRFKKINLLYNKIKKYKGKFKLQYLNKNQKLYFKARTYKLKGKKKIYSKYSKVLRVKT